MRDIGTRQLESVTAPATKLTTIGTGYNFVHDSFSPIFRPSIQQPLTWFFRVVFSIGIICFLLDSALSLVGCIPILGPALLAKAIPANPPASTGWFSSFSPYNNSITNYFSYPIASRFVTAVPVEMSVSVRQPPLNEMIRNVVCNTQEINEVSKELLTLANTVQYSSYSLMSASEIVVASDVYFKDPSLSGVHDSLQHPICSPIAYFRPTDQSPWQLAELHNEAKLFAYEFGEVVDIISEHSTSHLNISHNCLWQASKIHSYHKDISELRGKSLNQAEIGSLAIAANATYTPGMIAWLGGYGKGLRPGEQEPHVKFHGQWRNFKELTVVHEQVNDFFEPAIETSSRTMSFVLLLADIGGNLRLNCWLSQGLSWGKKRPLEEQSRHAGLTGCLVI
ncbi:hypothetical protein BKA64DRAFT_723726 [Cadophora sp. MPI-SDFR-AT-0126]|nr:hypothetical protein BKA64DRAFT_723726 [Leotiomycetes sp. MPI-SDFR-AT-0126]